MATPKLNPSRSISVIPSDYCNIPNPALYIIDVQVLDSGINYIQIDTSINIIELGVSAGSILYDYTNGIGVTVTSIVVGGLGYVVNHNGDVQIPIGNIVKIYNGQDDSTGCVLYVGQSGAVSVITEGGDDVVFGGVPGGTFFPVQVLKVKSDYTAASEILALR